jgi:hypothetical protein
MCKKIERQRGKEGEILINVPHDKEFVFHDGFRARNLLDLVSELEKMSDHDFHNFVNVHKNDFANWTDHVLSDKYFAEKLRTINSRTDTIQLIKDKINDVALGHSVINVGIQGIHIPRLENQSHIQNMVHKESHKENYDENHAEKNVEIGAHPKSSVHVNDTDENFVEEKKDRQHEKSEKDKAGHNWFKLFSKKDLSEKKLEEIEAKEEDKLSAENALKDDANRTERENVLWIALYFALVLLIITLLVYKLFL